MFFSHFCMDFESEIHNNNINNINNINISCVEYLCQNVSFEYCSLEYRTCYLFFKVPIT